MSLTFFKYVGAGNDFVFINHSELNGGENLQDLSLRLCDPKWGVGADGMVVFEPLDLSKKEFQWYFYNNDGSPAEMCGNAARCAVLFVKNEYDLSICRILTKAGWVEGKYIDDQTVSTAWAIESSNPQPVNILLPNEEKVSGFFINTGVPHFVIESENFNGRKCLLVQDHEKFSPNRTNVTLLWSNDEKHYTKSFERGVRKFTLACGTGVMAAACVLKSKFNSDQFELKTPGGAIHVHFLDDAIELAGPAKRVFKGQLY